MESLWILNALQKQLRRLNNSRTFINALTVLDKANKVIQLSYTKKSLRFIPRSHLKELSDI